MNEIHAMVIYFIVRALTIIACVVGIVYTISIDRQGWGWLVFLAICLAGTSYTYKKDDDD